MRDCIAHALHFVHQPLDVVQHSIDDFDQPVEIAGGPAGWQAPGQIALDDALDGTGNLIDAAHRPGNRSRSASPMMRTSRPPQAMAPTAVHEFVHLPHSD